MRVKDAVEDDILPHIPALLADVEPMPLNALKLLSVLLEHHPAWAASLHRCCHQ